MNNVFGCDKKDCIYDHICKKNIGVIYENKFLCDEYRNEGMFVEELIKKYIETN